MWYNSIEKKAWSVQQLAAALGMHEATIARHCKKGLIKAIKRLGRWFIPHEEAERVLTATPSRASTLTDEYGYAIPPGPGSHIKVDETGTPFLECEWFNAVSGPLFESRINALLKEAYHHWLACNIASKDIAGDPDGSQWKGIL